MGDCLKIESSKLSPLLNGSNSKLEASASNHLPSTRYKVARRVGGKMERVTESTVSNRDSELVATGNTKEHHHHSNGSTPTQILFKDMKTKPIVKLLFCKLCPSCEKNYSRVEREISRLQSTPDKELIYRLSKCMVELLVERNILEINLEDFRKQSWNLHAGNMYSEYSRVAFETFSEVINWGRIFVFLGFSISFSIHLMDLHIPSAANSVMEWSCQVVEEDLAKFFTANGGWVSN